jgi:hypothetical protein
MFIGTLALRSSRRFVLVRSPNFFVESIQMNRHANGARQDGGDRHRD